jgi:hypothetical protein
MLDTTMINEGDSATIMYSDRSMPGTVKALRKDASGRVYRVGIAPEGIDHVAWFHPEPGYYGLWNATVTVIAYV